jgi:hypothetical protein
VGLLRTSATARPSRGHLNTGATRVVLFGLMLLWTTGVLLAAAAPGREPQQWLAMLHHPAFIVHDLGAWLACMALAHWAWPHVQKRMRTPVRRRSGWAHAAGWMTVAGSGIALQVLPELLRDQVSDLHLWVGVVMPLPVLVHLFAKR